MNTLSPQNKEQGKAKIMLTAYACILVLLISPDSFTHDIFTCGDTPIFFMCGKAWMNGMIPYVDFADSKGPLLWLIQGIGYLISNYNYFGVCLLSCISYSVVFYYAFKIAYLFLKDYHLAIIVSIIMGFVYFNPWYHYEIKAEDWCQPFIIVTMYYLCKLFYTNAPLNKQSIYQTAYIVGLCWTCPLLIKYSIAVMMGIFVLSLAFFLISKKQQIIIPTLLFIAGVLSVFLPFALYFILIGHFDSLIEEYFITTFATIGDSNNATTYIHEILLTTADTRYAVLFFSSIIGCLLFSRMVPIFRYFPLISFCFFWFLSIHHVTSYYYLTSNFLFPIFLTIYCVNNARRIILNQSKSVIFKYTAILIALLTFWNYTFTDGYLLTNLFFFNNSCRQTYYKAAYVLSQVEKPKIVYLDCAIHGWETPVDGLPGSKYYNTQYGETKEMRTRKLQDITNRLPDFICMEEACLYEDAVNTVKEAKYKLCYSFNWWHHHFYFYTKHDNIVPPQKDIEVSNWDVLLKKRIF